MVSYNASGCLMRMRRLLLAVLMLVVCLCLFLFLFLFSIRYCYQFCGVLLYCVVTVLIAVHFVVVFVIGCLCCY